MKIIIFYAKPNTLHRQVNTFLQLELTDWTIYKMYKQVSFLLSINVIKEVKKRSFDLIL